MKRRKKLLLLSIIMLPVLCLFFFWGHTRTAAPTPEFSHPGGYYSESFYLELKSPSRGTIHYTTDGSAPSAESPVYTQPVLIDNPSANPNIYNSVQNVVFDWKNYTPDPAPVEKGTVIRAIFVNDMGISSEILSQTYFVGIPHPTEGYTLSLIFDPDLLFGTDGIYVTGEEYDSWYLSGNTSNPQPPANFEKDLEVPVTAQLIDQSRILMDQQVGLRLQGNTARMESKKRFSIFARPEYSGSNFFDYPIFDSNDTHSVMLKYYLPDAIAAQLLSDRSVSVQQNVPVRLFLNGEFLYDTYMLERYDSAYFRKYYQVDQYQLYKNGIMDSDSVVNPDLPPYGEFLFWVGDTDFSDPSQWQQFQLEADVQSYIDWMIANYFFCNIDFRDDHNHVLWRSSFPGSGQWEDTRWRWCLYDIDALAWIETKPSRGVPYTINIFSNHMNKDMQHTTLFPALCRNPEFCRRFVLSFMDMYNNNFSADRVNAVLESYGLTIDWMDGYFLKRPAYAAAHLAEEFGLTGTLETASIVCSQPHMGTVTVNTSVIDLSSGSWSGSYFTDYPITVTAQPRDGYEFIGWKGAANSTDPSVTVSVDGGILLEAMFAQTK